MDYSQLSDQEINAMVGKLVSKDGLSIIASDGNAVIHEYADCGEFKGICLGWKIFDPCHNQEDAWPIIESNYIALHPLKHKSVWIAVSDDQEHRFRDAKPMRAAMIVFLMSKDTFNA